MATMHKLLEEACSVFSSDLRSRYPHFSFWRWLFHLENKVGDTSVASCCKIWGLPAPLFAGHQGLRTLRKFSFVLWQESGTTPSFYILGSMQTLGDIYLDAWLWQWLLLFINIHFSTAGIEENCIYTAPLVLNMTFSNNGINLVNIRVIVATSIDS